MSDEILTLKEAADVARLSVDTIRNWVRSGALPHFRVLNRIRIYRRDLDAILHAGSPRSGAQGGSG
jgi:excisionase family DNA binding protein